jgi:activator of 2-hydroxyglutaryl-CoA dehydratase
MNNICAADTGSFIEEQAQSYTKVEMCYPVKLAVGRVVPAWAAA